MTFIIPIVGGILAIVLVLWWLTNTKPYRLITQILILSGMIALIAGGALALTGRFGMGLGTMLMGLGFLINARRRAKQNAKRGYGILRGAALELYIAPDSAKLDGTILVGPEEGQPLSDFDQEQLEIFYTQLSADAESRWLLEAYLDRHFSTWRDRSDPGAGEGAAGPEASRAMTKQEAYQILGLDASARPADIRKAHAGLSKRMRPDSLAGRFIIHRFDEALSTLLEFHSTHP